MADCRFRVTTSYEADPHKKDYNYEYNLMCELREQVRQCDRRINVARDGRV